MHMDHAFDVGSFQACSVVFLTLRVLMSGVEYMPCYSPAGGLLDKKAEIEVQPVLHYTTQYIMSRYMTFTSCNSVTLSVPLTNYSYIYAFTHFPETLSCLERT